MDELQAYPACPLCAGQVLAEHKIADCSRHPLYKPALSPSIRWLRCQGCGHVFRDGYYTDAACEIVFAETNANQQVGHDMEGQRLVSARMIEKVLPFQSSGDWLDVGFGNGSLLFTAQEYGFTPVGLDLRAANVESLSRFGVEAYCENIEAFGFNDRFSVISMADVVEHVPYPIACLQAAQRMLKDGGVLFLSMPNSDSMIWRVLDALNQNPYWGELEHYHNFGRSRLYALLQQCGFEPVRYGVSERYRACMEVVSIKRAVTSGAPAGKRRRPKA